jgi:hypothetical protein
MTWPVISGLAESQDTHTVRKEAMEIPLAWQACGHKETSSVVVETITVTSRSSWTIAADLMTIIAEYNYDITMSTQRMKSRLDIVLYWFNLINKR